MLRLAQAVHVVSVDLLFYQIILKDYHRLYKKGSIPHKIEMSVDHNRTQQLSRVCVAPVVRNGRAAEESHNLIL